MSNGQRKLDQEYDEKKIRQIPRDLPDLIIPWYQKNKRDLPWRIDPTPYHVWVSEIMLQQTRVEAVKAYYQRFLEALPEISDLAEAPEDRLLKLWEGLGYYNRVRNMQKAASQIQADYHGKFPQTYEAILSLPGIGTYTAGAISSFAFGLPKPAVDGNVLRVITRITGDTSDIAKQSTKLKVERALEEMLPKDNSSDFNQGLIELGAVLCGPKGDPKCQLCPVTPYCQAKKKKLISKIPVKSKSKTRKIQKKTVLIFRDNNLLALRKRENRGLLAGLYEFPNVEGYLDEDKLTKYCKEIGLMPVRIKKLDSAKHIFSHIEWHMIGYEILVDELEKTNQAGFLFVSPRDIKENFSIPSAFSAYANLI